MKIVICYVSSLFFVFVVVTMYNMISDMPMAYSTSFDFPLCDVSPVAEDGDSCGEAAGEF